MDADTGRSHAVQRQSAVVTGEGISPEPQVVGFDSVLVAQLVAAFGYAPVRGSVGDDPDLRTRSLNNLGTRYEGASGLELAVEALHVVFVIVRALAVVGFVVVSAAAREIGGRRMLGSGQR